MKNKLRCVLLIDDDLEDNFFHKLLIDEMNITAHVEVVVNGLEALAFLKNKNQPKPDLVFLDINMPKMNGWEFLEEHKKLNEEQKVKVIVIMLSSSLRPDDEKRAAEFPETIDFNSKPLREAAIARILEQYFPENKMES